MVLIVADQGPVSDAVARAAEALGPVRWASADDEDLWLAAKGCRAIVYIPAPSLLGGRLEPSPDVERVQAVLAASNAPGVEVVVMVVPSRAGYEAEIRAIRKYGAPYVLLEPPVVLEEIGAALTSESHRSIWLPRSGVVPVTSADTLAAAVVAAVDTEEQGRFLPIPAAEVDVAEVFKEAAQTVCPEVKVHAVWPRLHRTVRPIVRWLRGGEPTALSLADRLLPAPAPGA
jgi:hypothetical protein